MLRILLLVLAGLSVCFSPALAKQNPKAEPPFSFLKGSEMITNWRVEVVSFGLKDSGDSAYIGDMNRPGYGLGVQTCVLYPYSAGWSIGPNFDFSYDQVNNGSWYSLEHYKFGLGGLAKFDAANSSWFLFVNRNLGYVVTEQEISNPSGGTRPAGKFVANYPGWLIGASALFRVGDLVIGPYFNYGILSLISFKFKRLFNNKLETAWVNIDTTYIQAGVQIFWEQFSPLY